MCRVFFSALPFVGPWIALHGGPHDNKYAHLRTKTLIDHNQTFLQGNRASLTLSIWGTVSTLSTLTALIALAVLQLLNPWLCAALSIPYHFLLHRHWSNLILAKNDAKDMGFVL